MLSDKVQRRIEMFSHTRTIYIFFKKMGFLNAAQHKHRPKIGFASCKPTGAVKSVLDSTFGCCCFFFRSALNGVRVLNVTTPPSSEAQGRTADVSRVDSPSPVFTAEVSRNYISCRAPRRSGTVVKESVSACSVFSVGLVQPYLNELPPEQIIARCLASSSLVRSEPFQ